MHRRLLIPFFACTLSANVLQAQSKDCESIRALITCLDKNHYLGVNQKEDFSEGVLKELIKGIDSKNLYFSDELLAKLPSSELSLKKQLLNSNCQLVDSLASLFEQSLGKSEQWLEEWAKQDLHFTSKKQHLDLSEGKPKATEKERKLHIEAYWSYQVLAKVFSKEGEEDPFGLDKETLNSRVPKAKEQVLAQWKKAFAKMRKEGLQQLIVGSLKNAITAQYDPHTTYFDLGAKKDFETQLSSERLAFGFTLEQTAAGEVKITELQPGGAAWKSQALNEGDIITGITKPDGKEVSFSDLDYDEAMDIIGSQEFSGLTLHLRKVNGETKKIYIAKEKARSDENVIHSFVLEQDKKVGYMALPAFYTGSTQNGGCANDLAKEVLKLKSQNIEGLILDLRNNGGGSVSEALDLAGIFIDVGPITMVRAQGSASVSVLKDANRGQIYDGPMIVLLNSGSASASEIVAAALQDHGRALIVGSTSYGKSTGQVVIPVRKSDLSQENYGFVKITEAKFNRISGLSHQKIGIQPDVVLPDLYQRLEMREFHEQAALSCDTLSKKAFYTPLPAIDKAYLQEKSQQRLQESGIKQEASRLADSFYALYQLLEKPKLNLTFEEYKSSFSGMSTFWKEYEAYVQKDLGYFSVTTLQEDQELASVDEYTKNILLSLVQQLNRDVQLNEGFKIMCDMIELKNK